MKFRIVCADVLRVLERLTNVADVVCLLWQTMFSWILFISEFLFVRKLYADVVKSDRRWIDRAKRV